MESRRRLSTLTFCLAVVLALAGLASASAFGSTSLCKTNVEICPAASQYASGTVLKSATTPGGASFATNLGSISCTSAMTGKTTAATETFALPGEITALTFTSCKLSTETCTVTTVGLPYRLEISRTGSNFGTWKIKDHLAGPNPSVTIACGAIINCTVGTASALLSFEGTIAGAANAKAQSIAMGNESGGKCPSSAVRWSGTYTFSEPSPLYISQ